MELAPFYRKWRFHKSYSSNLKQWYSNINLEAHRCSNNKQDLGQKGCQNFERGGTQICFVSDFALWVSNICKGKISLHNTDNIRKISSVHMCANVHIHVWISICHKAHGNAHFKFNFHEPLEETSLKYVSKIFSKNTFLKKHALKMYFCLDASCKPC